MSATMKGFIAGAAAMLVLLIAIALLVILTGSYNVAASDRHNPVVGWALTTTMSNSVKSRAEDVGAVPEFTPAMISAGAGEYKAMCAHCHGGVGKGPAEWARTIRPQPPALAHAATEWSPQEVFWLVKHGVKMSAMPAFGPTHDDQTLWNIAAFVKTLPDLSEDEYAAFGAGHHGEKASTEGHGHGADAAHATGHAGGGSHD
ncbi:c-type cytochrome [Novosphingobium malaysiense]|uniref:c-type cytochrome n=1 Tax=Novosphingobium malaysiense TaxID=1348853 RepID=UPI0009DE2036|nr:cytochrome c [Novosphingobium malaysiense]